MHWGDALSAAQTPQAGALLEHLPTPLIGFGLHGGGVVVQWANACARGLPCLQQRLQPGAALAQVLAACAPSGGPLHTTSLPGAAALSDPWAESLAALQIGGAGVVVGVLRLADAQGVLWEITAQRTGETAGVLLLRDVSERHALARAQRELHDQTQILDEMEDLAMIGHWRRSPGDPPQSAVWSRGLMRLAGFEPVSQRVSFDKGRSGIPAEDLPAFLAARQSQDSSEVDYRWLRSDGEMRWVRARVHQASTDNPWRMEMGVVRDITQERHTAQQLRNRADFIERVASRIPGVLYQYRVSTQGRIEVEYISAAVTQFLHVGAAEVMADPMAAGRYVLRQDIAQLVRLHADALTGLQPWHGEFRLQFDNEPQRWFMTSASPHAEPDGTVVFHGFTLDITDRKRAEQDVERLAFYDPLTGLPNRRLLLARLDHAVMTSQRTRQWGALLFIDLDNFKNLNDTLGHDMGDQLLAKVGQRLVSAVREVDTVARFGGDEFVVLLENLAPSQQEAAARAQAVGHKLLQCMNEPFDLAGGAYISTPSIGVTVYGDERLDVDEVLKSADLAMYEAKASGRNAQRLFDPQMQESLNARALLEAELLLAWERREFTVHYQPVVDRAGRMRGAEAMVRWQHPQRGLLSGRHFMDLAEQTGLSLPLGIWVLEAVCDQLARWAAQAGPAAGWYIAVNATARQFHQQAFVAKVQEMVERAAIDPRLLKIELVESLLFPDDDEVAERMKALRALGVGFALDGFGTGHSSLWRLKRLPLEKIKIDKRFVREMLTAPEDAAIVRSIVALAHSLDLRVVAEGVRSAAQLKFLLELGCDGFQGALFGAPLPAQAWSEPRRRPG